MYILRIRSYYRDSYRKISRLTRDAQSAELGGSWVRRNVQDEHGCNRMSLRATPPDSQTAPRRCRAFTRILAASLQRCSACIHSRTVDTWTTGAAHLVSASVARASLTPATPVGGNKRGGCGDGDGGLTTNNSKRGHDGDDRGDGRDGGASATS